MALQTDEYIARQYIEVLLMPGISCTRSLVNHHACRDNMVKLCI